MGGEVRCVVMSSLPPEKVDLPPQFETAAITQKKMELAYLGGYNFSFDRRPSLVRPDGASKSENG